MDTRTGSEAYSGFCHEKPGGGSVEWYTPKWVFDRLGLRFAMDIASPIDGPLAWIPADRFVDQREDGLKVKLEGLIWCNPPFGKGIEKWIKRMADHGNGVCLLPARTDPAWFHEQAARADAFLFVNKRIAFCNRNGFAAGPGGAGTMLLAWGPEGVAALERFAAHAPKSLVLYPQR